MGKRKNPKRPDIRTPLRTKAILLDAWEVIKATGIWLAFKLLFTFIIFLTITFTYLETIGFEATVVFLLSFIAMFVGLRSMGVSLRRRSL